MFWPICFNALWHYLNTLQRTGTEHHWGQSWLTPFFGIITWVLSWLWTIFSKCRSPSLLDANKSPAQNVWVCQSHVLPNLYDGLTSVRRTFLQNVYTDQILKKHHHRKTIWQDRMFFKLWSLMLYDRFVCGIQKLVDWSSCVLECVSILQDFLVLKRICCFLKGFCVGYTVG